MLKVSKKFELDELKTVLENYYNESEISEIEQYCLKMMNGLMDIL